MINNIPTTNYWSRRVLSKYILIIFFFSILFPIINTQIFLMPEVTEWQRSLIDKTSGSYVSISFLFLATVILGPIWEELLFRSILFFGFSVVMPTWLVIISTSSIWSLLHYKQYSEVILVEIFIVGIVIGIARYKSDSIKPPIALHIANNLFAFIYMYIYSYI